MLPRLFLDAPDQELLSRGVAGFSSREPQAFYQLLLRGKSPLGGQSAKELKKQLQNTSEHDLLSLTMPAVEPPAKRLCITDVASVPEDGADEIAGDDGIDVADAIDDSSNDSDDMNLMQFLAHRRAAGHGVAANGSDDEIHGDTDDDPYYPETILGQRVHFVCGRADDKWSYHNRLVVKCNIHADCSKGRSTFLNLDIFGLRAAEIYLATWLDKSDCMPKHEHEKWRPTVSEMQAFMEAHPDF